MIVHFCKFLAMVSLGSLLVLFPKLALSETEDLKLITMEMPPYGLVEQDGRHTGLFHEINHMVLTHSGLAGQVDMLPLKRLMRGLSISTHDCSILGSTDYVKKNYMLLEPLGKALRVGAIATSGTTLQTYEDLYGLNNGVAIGTKIWDRFDNDTDIKKTEVTNYHLGMVMLQIGRIDVMTGVIESLSYLAKTIDPKFADNLSDPLVFKEIELFYVCRADLKDDDRLDVLQQTIIRLRENGEIKTLVEEYLN